MRETYDYHDIVLMANNATLSAKRHIPVTRVGGTQSVESDICSTTVLHPVPSKGPPGTLPQVVRANFLQLSSGIVIPIDERKPRVVRRGCDDISAGLAEGRCADRRESSLWECTWEVAVDGSSGLVENGGDKDGLVHRWESRSRVERGGDERTVTDRTNRFSVPSGSIDINGVPEQGVLSVKDRVERQGILAGSVGGAAVDVTVEAALKSRLRRGGEEAIVLMRSNM